MISLKNNNYLSRVKRNAKKFKDYYIEDESQDDYEEKSFESKEESILDHSIDLDNIDNFEIENSDEIDENSFFDDNKDLKNLDTKEFYFIDEKISNESNKPNKKVKKKKKKRFKRWVLVVFFLIFLTVFALSIFKLLDWNHDNKKTGENIEKINKISDVEEVNDDENTDLINTPNDKTSDYWYYVTFPLIQVDFNELKKKNSDTVAWIQINNTNINYPVVQTVDNEYYLNHSYDKSYNDAGWVFMDYRNDAAFTNKNTILYAHSRLDKTMFGELSKVLKESWYTNKDNHIIKISTPTENTLWQIFSVYKIKEETYYITTSFSNNNSYSQFLNTLKGRSKYNFNTNLNTNDKILTLSTCYSDTERTVVHAKLIKRSNRS